MAAYTPGVKGTPMLRNNKGLTPIEVVFILLVALGLGILAAVTVGPILYLKYYGSGKQVLECSAGQTPHKPSAK